MTREITEAREKQGPVAGKAATMAARARLEANARIANDASRLFQNQFDEEAIGQLSEPCAQVHSGEDSISFVVFLDGSLWLLDENYHGDETDDDRIYIESPNPLADALRESTPIAVSSAALAHMGFAQSEGRPSDEAIAAWAESAGGDAEGFDDVIGSIFENLDDPLIDMSDEGQNWSQEQADAVERVLIAALQTDPRFDEGFVSIYGAGPDGSGYIDEIDCPDGDAIAERAWRIVAAVVDDIHTMAGTQYEYNDGAYGRASGYSALNACIATPHVDQVSAHERVRAHATLRRMLIEKGHDGEAVSAILAI